MRAWLSHIVVIALIIEISEYKRVNVSTHTPISEACIDSSSSIRNHDTNHSTHKKTRPMWYMNIMAGIEDMYHKDGGPFGNGKFNDDQAGPINEGQIMRVPR
jgi:hypothetical protein